MAASPEALIFHAIRSAGAEASHRDAPPDRPVRSDDEAARLTSAVLSTLHQAGYRIVRRDEKAS